MVKTPRSRRGISPILATLLLVVIAVAAIVITYAWVMTFTGGATGQAGVWLDYDAVSWNAGNITIYLRNKGTSDAEIDAVYVGTSYENLEEQTSVTYSPSTVIEKDGGTITIAIDYLWSSDTRYYFTIAPKLGQALKFEKQAP
jgi:flagellin-like protein